MEKRKLISTIKKLYKPNFSNLGPTDIYTYFVSTFPYNELAKAMSSEDIIMASFLLPMVNTPEVLDKQYDFIKFNLFGFNLIEIDSQYADVTCDACNGDGYEICDECGGDGKVDCDSCGGDGKQRRVYQETGKIFLTDSLLTNEYSKGSLVFKVFKITSNKVYYYNQFEETVKVLFMGNGDVMKINETKPDEYIIYRKK